MSLLGSFKVTRTVPLRKLCAQGEQDRVPGAFCRGRGMATAGPLQQRLWVGVLKSWAGPEHVREEWGSRREQCAFA